MSQQIVSIAGGWDEPGQMSFEGLPVVESRYRVKGSRTQATDRKLTIGDGVSVVISGRVTGIEHSEQGEGSVARVHVIEVLEARLGG